jgi:hypothetical protein
MLFCFSNSGLETLSEKPISTVSSFNFPQISSGLSFLHFENASDSSLLRLLHIWLGSLSYGSSASYLFLVHF